MLTGLANGCPSGNSGPSPSISGLLAGCRALFLTQEPGCTGTNQATLGGIEDGVWQWDAVSHRGPIKAVLSHHAATTPTLLPLPPLGPPVLKPDLMWGKTGSRRAFRRRHSEEDVLKCPLAGSPKNSQLVVQIPDLKELCLLFTQNTQGLIIVWIICNQFPLRFSREPGMIKIKSKYYFPCRVKKWTIMFPDFSHWLERVHSGNGPF